MAANVQQVMDTINEACRRRGGKYAEYSCKIVSWDDVSRGTNANGSLSCWGANITDTYLKSKDGQHLFTVRSDNWNEKLGKVNTREVALVAGEAGPRGELQPFTLRTVLKQLGQFGGYAGLNSDLDLSDDRLDEACSIRFQTTFLPVEGELGTLEFATEAYNYNTTSDEDPRNLVLLCTTQGVAVQQDGAGAKRIFHHAVDEDEITHRYWLEAERSKHKVGGEQLETAEERADALQRGKATSSVIGIRAMGQRFNVLMTIQVPLEQKTRPPPMVDSMMPLAGCAVPYAASVPYSMSYSMCSAAVPESCSPFAESMSIPLACSAMVCEEASSVACRRASAPVVGTANAARVSRGSEVDTWEGLTVREPKRNPSEHVTVTVVMYNTVTGGVPSEADVVAAIDDLESLYAACSVSGRLADSEFDFMKAPLTSKEMGEIKEKIVTQPYKPPAVDVARHDTFPTDP